MVRMKGHKLTPPTAFRPPPKSSMERCMTMGGGRISLQAAKAGMDAWLRPYCSEIRDRKPVSVSCSSGLLRAKTCFPDLPLGRSNIVRQAAQLDRAVVQVAEERMNATCLDPIQWT